MKVQFWKIAILKNLENSVETFYDRVLILTLQVYLVQLQYKKVFNKGDSQNDSSVKYQKWI